MAPTNMNWGGVVRKIIPPELDDDLPDERNHPLPPHLPWGLMAVTVIMMLGYLGFMSVQGGFGIGGTMIGMSLMMVTWSAAKFYTEHSIRAERRDNREETNHLRNQVKEYRRAAETTPVNSLKIRSAAKSVVDTARVRREDLDGDGDHFMYEVDPAPMIELSNALEKEHD